MQNVYINISNILLVHRSLLTALACVEIWVGTASSSSAPPPPRPPVLVLFILIWTSVGACVIAENAIVVSLFSVKGELGL